MFSHFDPATAEMLWTLATSALLLATGGMTLAMLPWSDRDILAVDQSARTLAKQALSGRLRPAPRRA